MRHYFFTVTLSRASTCSYVRYKYYCISETKKAAKKEVTILNEMDGWDVNLKQIDEAKFLQPESWQR